MAKAKALKREELDAQSAFRLTSTELVRLQQYAQAIDRPVAWCVRDALQEYLANHEKTSGKR